MKLSNIVISKSGTEYRYNKEKKRQYYLDNRQKRIEYQREYKARGKTEVTNTKVTNPKLLLLRSEDLANYAKSDRTHSLLLDGFVYVMANPKLLPWIKVGHSRDYERRLSSYQTGDPLREYYICGYEYFADRFSAEKEIHEMLAQQYKQKNEWFDCDPDIILDTLNILSRRKIKEGTDDTINSRHRNGCITKYQDTHDRAEGLSVSKGDQLSFTI